MALILASASPRRQELLRLITPDFTCCPADLDETVPAGLAPERAPAYLARQKARLVAQRFPRDTVLGCDTAVLLGDRLLGKPADRAEARAMLTALSGRTHAVVTGCCLCRDGREVRFSAAAAVEFYPLSDAAIAAYLATGEADDKAGAYGIQGKGALLIRGIRGDFYTVMGLPVARLARALARFAPDCVARPANP